MPAKGGLQILTPDLEVPPYTESLYCAYGQWDGPEMGVVSYTPLHPNEFHHHSLVKDATLVDNVEPGDFLPCGEEELLLDEEGEGAGVMTTAPLFHAIMQGSAEGDGNRLQLPEGTAIRLPPNQKWSADVHFINTTDKLLKVNVAFNMDLVEADEVEQWISSFDHDSGGLDLPPGEESTVVFDCPLQEGGELLSVLAHMHSFGERYTVELIRASGEVETLLRVDEWESDFRYSAPSRGFEPGQIVIEEGDVLRTHCTWFNSSPNALGFPEEMCTTSGAILGMTEADFCVGDRVETP